MRSDVVNDGKTVRIPRGIRNNNPFNIRKSFNSWRGKLKNGADPDFEQFCSMDYGLRAGFLLLRNAYIGKGYDTPKSILSRYAPNTENNLAAYLNYVCSCPALNPDTKISVNDDTFYWLVQRILRYESKFDLSRDRYILVINKFNLW